MKIFSVSFLLFGLQVSYCLPARGDSADDDTETTTASPISNYMDRQCGEDLSNLWLDVVVVVDTSKGMTNQGLTKVAANIASVFSMGTRIGTQAGEPRTTRVALVTYNQYAKVNAGLDVYQSLDDLYDDIFTVLHAVSSTDESYLAKGIAAAEDLLHIAKQNVTRSHYKQVVIVYASSYKGTGDLNPLPVADRLKTADVSIITVAFNQDNDGALLEDLALVGSPNFNFANTDSNPVGEIQGALLQANCFCPNGWTQYRTSYAYADSYRFGVCIAPTVIPAVWRAAKLSCRNQWNNAYLLNEYDINKHNYVLDLIQNTTAFTTPYQYHIGLSYSKGAWYWEQPDGQPLKQLQHWTNWNPGYPISDSSLTVVTNLQLTSEMTTGWENTDQLKNAQFYICEVASCDTDNYCDKVFI
ncbi:hypothetical protein B9Z55_005655 [Caenorhabditis nigoni]|uniref:VWFA domain-containing protein n=1 Tax=Caenorhabditis nigoni TaxID=1611254 RepID=A0A2G5V1T4_9PELO|nr:hypothetical protein B9Z55_005655 [Caenorhabditis nigoni]